MANLLELYEYAEVNQIDVDWIPMARAASLSVPLGDGECAIAIDPWKMESVELESVCLAHELGHCKTGSFYNRYAARDVRQKHENRADKWAIEKLIPKDELERAIASGLTEPWDLAERFGVTIPFMQKAICWYTYRNLATELYY